MQQKSFTGQSRDMSAMQDALENAERECMAARSECRVLRKQLAETQAAYKEDLKKCIDIAKRQNEEMKQQAVCLSVVALLICAATCVIAAPWWTAVAPTLFAFYALRRAGL